jgi:hypothetical protein
MARKESAIGSLSFVLANVLSRHEAGGRGCLGRHDGVFQGGVLGWSKAELDDGAGVRDQFGLPAVIALKFLHGSFGPGIPMAGGYAGEIARLDQRALDLSCAGVVDSALSWRSCCLRALIEQLGRGGAAASMGKRRARQRG